jgi:hypothetical protein
MSLEAAAVEMWLIDRLVFYARNPRKNDAAVDRMCGSIKEFGFKIPVLARSDSEVVDGHPMRIKSLTMPAKRAFLNAESVDVFGSDGDSGKCFAPARMTVGPN